MTDETSYHPQRGNGNTLQQDMWRMEDRLLGSIKEMRDTLTVYVDSHALDHGVMRDDLTTRRADVTRKLEAMTDLMLTSRVEHAKRQGIWSVFVFLGGVIDRYWKILAVAFIALLAALNRLSITIGG
jgi:hypothetical protein